MTHYDGQYREGQDKRQTLLESLADAIRGDKFELEDIAEFLNEFMYDMFSMELDDNSHYDVAKVAMEAWVLVKQGIRPQITKRQSGASCSELKDQTEEVSDDEDMEDTDMTDEPSKSSSQPKIVTDDDGWSTIVPQERK